MPISLGGGNTPPTNQVLPNPQLSMYINGVFMNRYMDQENWTVTQQFGRQGTTMSFQLFDQHEGPPIVPKILQTVRFLDDTNFWVAQTFTGFTPTSATDSSASWVINQWLGYRVFCNGQIVSIQSNTATTLTVDPWGVTPTNGDEFIILGPVIFQGLITNPKWIFQGPNLTMWHIDSGDFTYFADASIVVGDFSFQRADTILRNLTGQANCGITTNHLQVGPVIPRYQANYIKLSEVWSKVSKLASQTSDWGYYVDDNLDLHFFNQLMAQGLIQQNTPIVFTDDPRINPTPIHGYADTGATFEYDGSAFRNSCVVRGGRFTGLQTDIWKGTGRQTSFPLTFPILTLNPHVHLEIDGIPYTVGIAQTQPQGTGAAPVQSAAKNPQFILTQNASNQWFMQTGTNLNAANPGPQLAPQNGTTIVLKYTFTAPVTATANDYQSINNLAQSVNTLPRGGNRGIYRTVVADRGILDIGSAQARAQRELTLYANLQERVTMTTAEGWPGHINAGQVFTFGSQFIPNYRNNYAIGFPAIPADPNQVAGSTTVAKFICNTVTITGVQGMFRKYAIQAQRIQ